MTTKRLLAGLAIALLACSACSTSLSMTFQGDKDLNPNQRNEPVPTKVVVFLLRSPDQLGDTFVEQREITVRVGSTEPLLVETVPESVQHVGVLALFSGEPVKETMTWLGPIGEARGQTIYLKGRQLHFGGPPAATPTPTPPAPTPAATTDTDATKSGG
jgi:hypothetical protein